MISFQSTEAKFAYLEARAKRLGLGPTQMARAVLNKWLLEGSPAIDEREKAKGIVEMPKPLMDEIQATNLYHP